VREDGHRYTFTVPDLPWKSEDDPLPADVPPSPDVRDEAGGPCCSLCGKALRGTDWACLPCKRHHHLPVSTAEWPEWAKFLLLSEQKRRRHLKRDPAP
jgi:hypothetical protein